MVNLLAHVVGSPLDSAGQSGVIPVSVLSIVVALLCVVAHWGTLEALIWVARSRSRSPRLQWALPFGVLVLLTVHCLEILLFAGAMWASHAWLLDPVGHLAGDYNGSFYDMCYYSACVYTTVGFGDIVPVGPLRFMAGIEAITGLLMLTWSASFTFLAMQFAWQKRWGEAPPETLHPEPTAGR